MLVILCFYYSQQFFFYEKGLLSKSFIENIIATKDVFLAEPEVSKVRITLNGLFAQK